MSDLVQTILVFKRFLGFQAYIIDSYIFRPPSMDQSGVRNTCFSVSLHHLSSEKGLKSYSVFIWTIKSPKFNQNTGTLNNQDSNVFQCIPICFQRMSFFNFPAISHVSSYRTHGMWGPSTKAQDDEGMEDEDDDDSYAEFEDAEY